MSNTNPARGMRDFLPSDVRKRNYVINIIKEVYESYGFEPLETPSVENLDILTNKYGEEGNQLMFKILKRGEKLQQEVHEGKITDENELSDLALRYDLTVPLARVVANYKNDLPKFFKRYQIQPVWRADRPARGRYREFYQSDVDAIGSSSMIVEAELISAVCEILERLGFDDFTIRINHREILFALLRSSGIPEEKHFDALIALDKIDKIGRIGVEKELAERGISDTANKRLITAMEFFVKDISVKSLTGKEKLEVLELLKLDNKVESEKYETLESLRSSFKKDGKSKEDTIETVVKEITNFIATGTAFIEISSLLNNDEKGLVAKSQLEKIWKLSMLRYSGLRIKLDPSLARGLSYYTGAIFEINVPDLAGSLGGGGRYDGLIGMFGKEQIPAVGFSLGLERILLIMDERGMFPEDLTTNSADVMVTIWNEDAIGESLKLANELRSQGLRVLVYPEADKLGKQFKYADSLNIPFVCILGENEIADNKVALKNMKSGEQEIVLREQIAEKINLS